MKNITLFCLFAFLLCACARPSPTPPELTEHQWEKMIAMQGESGPYRIQFSLRFGEEGNTRRVTGILWGNDGGLMRMDIMAGVGAVLAKMEDDPEHFLLYAVRENKCYYQNGPEKPLLKVGMPIPFNLPQLAALLRGHYAAVFGEKPQQPSENGRDYLLGNPPGGMLVLFPDARPEAWKQGANGWEMKLAYGDSDLPEQLKLAGPEGKRAIISVKDRERPEKLFDNEQMRLEIPSGTPRMPLARYKAS